MRYKQLRRILIVVITVLILGLSACDQATGQVDSSANTGDTALDAQPNLAETIAANQTAIVQSGANPEATGISNEAQTINATPTVSIPTETTSIATVDPGDGGSKNVPTNDTSGSGDDWNQTDLLAIIAAASKLEPLTPKNDVDEIGRSEDAQYRYIQEKHNVIENKESVLFLGQNDTVLYPGAIIQGKNVYDFVYEPIITTRTPITLSLSLEGVTTTGSSIKKTVDDPSVLSNVRQGINELLKTAITPNTTVPARFSYENSQVYSSEDRNLSLGVSGSYADVSMSYDFDWSTKSKKTRIMSIYKQVYYTVDIDMPQNSYDFFDPSIGVAGLAAALPPGSMPMYVSSVSYGWMAVLFIETDFNYDQMDTALNVAYDPKGNVEADLDFGFSSKEVFDKSDIYIIVYGGSTVGITSNTLKGLSGLMELISASKNFGSDSPGVPISYTLRHLSDNLIAKIALTEEYTISRPIKLREFIKVTVDKFDCHWADDEHNSMNYDYIEMDRLFAWVFLYRGPVQLSNKKVVDYWSSGDGVVMKSGNSWTPPPPAHSILKLDLEINNQPLTISSYTISLAAEANEFDDVGSDEWDQKFKNIEGNNIFKIPLVDIQLNSKDFWFFVWFKIEQATADEYCLYNSGDPICIPTTPNPN